MMSVVFLPSSTSKKTFSTPWLRSAYFLALVFDVDQIGISLGDFVKLCDIELSHAAFLVEDREILSSQRQITKSALSLQVVVAHYQLVLPGTG